MAVIPRTLIQVVVQQVVPIGQWLQHRAHRRWPTLCQTLGRHEAALTAAFVPLGGDVGGGITPVGKRTGREGGRIDRLERTGGPVGRSRIVGADDADSSEARAFSSR